MALTLNDPLPPDVLDLIRQYPETNLRASITRFYIAGRAQGRAEGILEAERIFNEAAAK